MTLRGDKSERAAQINRHIGALIREARRLRGMSQMALGTATGITPSSIGEYEAGLYQITAARLVMIAHVLGIDPSLLMPILAPDDRLVDLEEAA